MFLLQSLALGILNIYAIISVSADVMAFFKISASAEQNWPNVKNR